jgi:hypothetical protein
MRFYVIKRKDVYKPQIFLPYSLKEQIDISKGKIDVIGKMEIWQVKESDFTFFSDILTEPVLMLSSKAKEVFQIYDSKMEFKQIILFGRERETVMQYYLPVLHEISGNQKENNLVEISREDKDIFQKTPIVRLKIKEKKRFLADLEIIESFLKRRLSGVEIVRTDVIWKEALTE